MFFFFPPNSVHLYYLFPSLEEGGLATYRTAIVQNQHLAMLAKVVCVTHLKPLPGPDVLDHKILQWAESYLGVYWGIILCGPDHGGGLSVCLFWSVTFVDLTSS